MDINNRKKKEEFSVTFQVKTPLYDMRRRLLYQIRNHNQENGHQKWICSVTSFIGHFSCRFVHYRQQFPFFYSTHSNKIWNERRLVERQVTWPCSSTKVPPVGLTVVCRTAVYRLKKKPTIDFIVRQIHDFMRELATSFPNLVTVTNQGQSHEGRDMLMLKISSGGAAKNAIFVDGGPFLRLFSRSIS